MKSRYVSQMIGCVICGFPKVMSIGIGTIGNITMAPPTFEDGATETPEAMASIIATTGINTARIIKKIPT